MSNRKLVSFRLPDELMHTLRQRADHNGISVTELVCRLLWYGLQSDFQNDLPKSNLPKGSAQSSFPGSCQSSAEGRDAVDARIALLEAEIQELRRTRQPNLTNLTAPPTPLYALLTQGSIAQDSNLEMRARLTRLEQMMETLLTRNSAPGSSYLQNADAPISTAAAPYPLEE